MLQSPAWQKVWAALQWEGETQGTPKESQKNGKLTTKHLSILNSSPKHHTEQQNNACTILDSSDTEG